MAWASLVTGRDREGLATAVRDIVTALAAEPGGTVADLIDRVVLYEYAAQAEIVAELDGATERALELAIAELTRGRCGPDLLAGAAGLGWVLAHVAPGEVAELVCGRIAALLEGWLAREPCPYDLVTGAVGYAVYALERGDAGRALAVRVLDRLAREARPRAGGLSWHTSKDLLPPWQLTTAPDGYWNLGLAHGAPGVIALLARFLRDGIEVERARALIEPAVVALLGAAPAHPDGRYPGWQAGGHDHTTPPPRSADPRRRLAWCYNDLSVSVALLAAAEATGTASWRAEALSLAVACSRRTVEDADITDTCLCHGALGAAHLFNRLYQATGDAGLAVAARAWLDRGLALRNDQPFAGFPSWLVGDDRPRWRADATMLNGAAGAGLVLVSMISGGEPLWDRRLLTDLRPAAGHTHVADG
jgi:class I lanthipeptide synthase